MEALKEKVDGNEPATLQVSIEEWYFSSFAFIFHPDDIIGE